MSSFKFNSFFSSSGKRTVIPTSSSDAQAKYLSSVSEDAGASDAPGDSAHYETDNHNCTDPPHQPLQHLSNEEYKKQWHELHGALKRTTSFGLYSIYKTHNRDGKFKLMAYVPLAILMTQVIIPPVLLYDRYDELHHDELCPQEGSWREKVMMFALSSMYLLRAIDLFGRRYFANTWLFDRDSLFPLGDPMINTKSQLLDKIRYSRLRYYGFIDDFMDSTYEITVYALNLVIIFLQPGAYAMMITSLSLEFTLQLDDIFVARYFQVDCNCVSTILQTQLLEEQMDFTQMPHVLFERIFNITLWVSCAAATTFCHLMAFYGVICK